MSNTSLISSLEYTMKERQSESSGFSLTDLAAKSFYSVGGAATSAVAGFVNTGISLANLVREDDFEYVDTGDWIQNWMGGQAAEFYEEHDDFIDLAGLIGGSLLPGGLAVKGLRAGQTALRGANVARKIPPASVQKQLGAFAEGSSSIYTRATTGLRKALVPNQELNTLTAAIRNGSHKIFSKEDYLKLAREGLHQNVLEAAVYEAATVLTMAKHSSLSPEDLNYFESLSHAKGDLGFGIFLGGAIGTLGTFAGSVAKTRKAFDEAAQIFNPYAFNSYKSVNANLFGDKVVDDVAAIRFKEGQLDSLQRQLKEARADRNLSQVTEIENKIKLATDAKTQAENKLLTDIGDGITDELAKEEFQKFAAQVPVEKLANAFAGAENVKTIAKGGNIKGPVEAFTVRLEDVADDIPFGESFKPKTGVLEISPENLQKMDNEEILNYLDQLPPVTKAERALDKIQGTKLHNDLQLEMNKFNRQEYKVEFDKLDLESPKLQNLRDEKSFDEFVGNFSQSDWGEIETLASSVEQTERVLAKKTTDHFTMAKMYRLFDNADADTLKELKREYPTVHEALTKSRAIQENFGPTQAYISLKDGQVLRDQTVVPFARDLGNIKYTPKSIEIPNANLSYEIDVAKPIYDMSHLEATARYALAESDPLRVLRGYTKAAAGSSKKVIDTYDFSRLNAAMKAMRDLPQADKISIRYQTANGAIESFDNIKDLQAAVIRAKRLAVPRMTIRNRMSKKQIATILDVDEAWVNGDHLMRKSMDNEIVFKSLADPEGQYFQKPRYLQVNYSRSFETEAQVKGTLGAEKRYNEELFADRQAFEGYMGTDATLFPDIDPTNTSGADHTTGAFAANQAEYGKEQFKASGAIINTRHNRRQKEIYDRFSVVGQHVAQKPDAIAEVNVIQNLGRQSRYYYYDSVDDLLNTELDRIGAPKLHELFAMNPGLGLQIKKTLSDALPTAAETAADAKLESVFHNRATVQKLREVWDSIEAVTEIDPKTANLTKESMEQVNSILLGAANSIKYSDEVASLKDLAVYKFKNIESANYYKAWTEFNDEQMSARRLLAKRTGSTISYEERMLWSGPLDTEMYSHVAFVDFKNSSKVYGTKNRGVIVAKSQADLQHKQETLMRTMGDEISITPLEKAEDRLKALDAYDVNAAVTDNVVDSTLASKGVLWEVMPEFNDNVVQEMLNAQIKAGRNLDRGYVALRYQKEFAQLREAEKVFQSKGAISQSARKADIGPWGQQIKAALDISHSGSYEWYVSAQQKVADAVGKAYATTKGLVSKAAVSDLDNEWKLIDKYLERTGLPRPYAEVTDYLKLNSNVSPERLEGFVGRLNAIASTVMLRLDQTQAIVNAFSMPIMLTPEMQQLRGFIKGENLKRLEELTSTVVSKGVSEPTNMKLATGAAIEFWSHPNRRQMIEEFRRQGIIGNTLHEVQSAAEAISLRPNMSEGKIKAAGQKAISILAKPADTAEEFVKFTAARSAQKLIELAPKGTIPENAQWAIIRNFVDKVHGNYVASQRPTLFKGFAGQAIGLFQTYQFNLYQRLFNHLGKDSKRLAATMIGTQAGIFGAQSLPGFQLLNNHIAERSEDYNNIYSRVQDNFGDEVSDWLLYGTGSNIFKPIPGLGGVDLYSRGDLTPRTPILIPTSLNEIPVVSMTRKAITSFSNAVSKSVEAMGAGADAEVYKTIALEALAHNGLNRPLAGVSQMALGYRTTNAGKLLMTYDNDENLGWTFALKALGTKDLDEAIAVNQYYNALQYKTKRYESLDKLGRTFRDVIRSNDGNASADAYMHFMEEYVSTGGNYSDFSRWAQNQIVGANDSIINKLKRNNTSPEGRYLQSVLGGDMNEF